MSSYVLLIKTRFAKIKYFVLNPLIEPGFACFSFCGYNEHTIKWRVNTLRDKPDERVIRRLVIAELRNACGNQNLEVVAATPLGENWQTVVFHVTLALSDYNLGALPIKKFDTTTGVQELVGAIMYCLQATAVAHRVPAALLN